MNATMTRAALHAAVVEATRAGESAAVTAARLGVTERTVQRHRAGAGISQPSPQRWTATEVETARQLLADGASYGEVARTIGRNVDYLRRRFPGYGWTYAERGAWAAMRPLLESLCLDWRSE